MRDFEGAATRALPLLLTLVAQVLLSLPGVALGLEAPLPSVALISVCYWSLYRPGGLDPVSILVVGLVCDALAGLPLGTAPLTLLLLRFAIPMINRRYAARRLRFYEWTAIPLLLVGGVSFMHVVGCALLGTPLSVVELLFKIGATLAFYPPAHYVFNHVLHLLRNLPRPAS